jgi:hypothetical protein
MARLLIHVEGETEETFVREVLAARLYANGYEKVGARLVGNARLRARRGGIRAWSSVRKEIARHLCEDSGAIATTMVDYYALPRSGDKAWPGRDAPSALPIEAKARFVEDAIRDDLKATMGCNFDARRFVPFVIMYEFEGLLFSDCEAFSRGIQRSDLRPAFEAIRNQFTSPEEINDSPVTAPSKRVLALIPNYEKPLLGTMGALEIGLEAIEQQCPHFKAWMEKLQQVARVF